MYLSETTGSLKELCSQYDKIDIHTITVRFDLVKGKMTNNVVRAFARGLFPRKERMLTSIKDELAFIEIARQYLPVGFEEHKLDGFSFLFEFKTHCATQYITRHLVKKDGEYQIDLVDFNGIFNLVSVDENLRLMKPNNSALWFQIWA